MMSVPVPAAVVSSAPEPPGPFAAPWEAVIFALVVKLHEAGHFAWSEFATSLSAQIHAHPDRPYYQCWNDAAVTLLEQRGLVDAAALLKQALAVERFRASDHHHVARTEPIAIARARR